MRYLLNKNRLKNWLDYSIRPLRGMGRRLAVGSRRRSTNKLVMTLLVRDEADVVKGNIEFHLDHGVDFIIATDNGSVDGTRDILNNYKRKGLLYLIDEPNLDYSQMLWVNRMGEIAWRDFHADLIFHADADEFWLPDSGSLKNELLYKNEFDTLKVPVVNMLPTHNRGDESFPRDTKYAVVNPFFTDNLKKASEIRSLYLYQYDPKVIYRIKTSYRKVNQGNHNIVRENGIDINERRSTDIRIYHYPLRSRAHFHQKICNGGASYERNTRLGLNVGWQWRLWFEAYKDGSLDRVYDQLALSQDEIESLSNSGVIQDYTRIQQFIAAYI